MVGSALQGCANQTAITLKANPNPEVAELIQINCSASPGMRMEGVPLHPSSTRTYRTGQMSSPQGTTIRILCIDNHRILLCGLERLVEGAGTPMKVVGSARTCREALMLLEKTPVDLILLEPDLGPEDGVDEIPKLIAISRAKVLVLTRTRDKSWHDRAIRAGASGIVEKEADSETLLNAIGRVYEGQIWLDRTATARLFIEYARKSAADPEQEKIQSLTKRELAAISAMLNNVGLSAKCIAKTLYISEHTLRNHLTSVYSKLEVANRMELLVYAQKHGLVGATTARMPREPGGFGMPATHP